MGAAKNAGVKWVETSPEVIKYFNPQGLGGTDYFIYQNVKVCEYGKQAEIEARHKRQMGQIIFGDTEGKVLNR